MGHENKSSIQCGEMMLLHKDDIAGNQLHTLKMPTRHQNGNEIVFLCLVLAYYTKACKC